MGDMRGLHSDSINVTERAETATGRDGPKRGVFEGIV